MFGSVYSIGETVSAAWLFCPPESEGHAAAMAKQALAYGLLNNGALATEPTIEYVTPDDRRIVGVDPKDWGPGTRVAIASARVTSVVLSNEQVRGMEFLASLSPVELAQLRTATRRAAAVYGQQLTDAECDDIVMQIGPETAERRLKDAVDRGR